MQIFFSQNLDYLSFFYGAAFFLLAAAGFIFYVRERSRRALTLNWMFFVLFAVASALSKWIDLPAMSYYEGLSLFGALRLVLVVVSFVFLLEFSRSSYVFLTRRRFPLWLYVLPYAAFTVGLFLVHDSGLLNRFVALTLRLPATCAAGAIFLLYASRQERASSRWIYRFIGIAFFLYSWPLRTVDIDAVSVFSTARPSQLVFSYFFWVPMAFHRALGAMLVAFLLIHQATRYVLDVPIRDVRGRRRQVLMYTFLFFYVLFFMGGYILMGSVDTFEKKHLKQLVLTDARNLADIIGMSDIRQFISEEDVSVYKKYLKMHNRMSDLPEMSFYTRALYLVLPGKDRFTFAVGSSPQVFPHEIVPAFGAQVPHKAIADAFYSKKPTLVGPYMGNDGRAAYTVFFPVLDRDDQALTVLGIDIDADRVQWEVYRVRLFVIGICFTFLVLLVVGYAFLIIFALKGLELQIQKNNLDKALVNLRETQRELARSEETFRGILNNSPNAIFGFDRDLRLIFWNQGAEKFYGYRKTDVIDEKNPLLSKKVTDVLGIVPMENEIAGVFEGRTLIRELAQKNMNGENLDVSLTIFPVKDPQGHILFVLGLAQDITTHKRYEERLADAHAKLKSFLDGASHVSMSATTLSGAFQMWNDGSEELFGYKNSEILGKTPLILHDPEDLKAMEEELFKKTGKSLHGFEAITEMVRQGGVFQRECVMVKKDGRRFPVDLTIAAIRNDKGEIVGFLGIGIDRSRTRRVEKELLETQEKYRDLVENLNVGVYINTPGPEGRFFEANPALLKIFETDSVENVSVKSLYDDPEERKRFSDKLLKDGFVKNYEFRGKTLKGRLFWASVTAVVKHDDKYGEVFYGIIQDVTEQKHLEVSLSEERGRLKTIADSIGAGLSLINKDYDIVWVNQVLEKWFGKLDTIRGRKCYEAYKFHNMICEECPSRRAMITGQVQTGETRSVFPDGRVMDFLLICTPVKNEHGEVEQVLELTLDMTERKSMIEMLEFERALSRNVIDSISDSLIVLDCNSRIVLDVNRYFMEQTGLRKEDVVGKRCSDVYQHGCSACESCALEEVTKHGRTIEATHIHKLRDGREAFVDVTLSPLKDEKGRIIGVIHIAHDVTDRKRLEDELKRYSHDLENLIEERTRALQVSELMFRNLFESAQDAILIIDAVSGNIISANPYLLHILECSMDQLLGLHYNAVPFFRESLVYDKAFLALKEQMSVLYDDVRLKTCAGKEIEVEFRASTYFVEKRKIIQCNIRDITERKKIEKIKTEFVSMVSHELRTPLSAIKEGVEIVADGTQGKINKSQKECLLIALSNIKRLNRLIGDILDISKIQSNLLKVHMSPCNICEVIDQVYSLVRIEIEKHGLVFVTDCPKDLPFAMADKDRLIQVLMNLLNNAIKFTRERSRIVLTVRQVHEAVEFSIRDEGMGIPQEEVARLFGKFVQLDSTLVRRVGGTGLGLYISRNLVEAMGGHIWVESTLGEGSIFKFTLPITRG
ncbi:MAG: PAS domain S-box protein, partial [Candidatus Omnitrophica bacterium]|nr:PAS domain S-box protein [Candidatus Omnitrophota bacterium]MDD5137338.1 PAS domain S-box protein [Candidatus Omnitrophota bacterium]MDD5538247.1 PAS domain S-box protein [Candidatus Omnitrophota bacterium]